MLVASAVLVLARCGGGEETGAPPAASGTGGATTSTSTSSTPQGGAGGQDAGCPPEAPPPNLPDGWVEYTSWSCDCRFYLPGSPEVMPDPIQWEACPGEHGLDCTMMVTDWAISGDFPVEVPVEARAFDLKPGGSALLAFRRNAGSRVIDMVAEADGSPLHAVLTQWKQKEPGCMIGEMGVDEGKFLHSVSGNDANGNVYNRWYNSDHRGALGGSLGDPEPVVLAHYETELTFNWAISGTWIARVNLLLQLHVMPWDMSYETLVTSPGLDPEGLQTGQVLVHEEAVFWTSSKHHQNGINVWTEQGGALPFIRWIGDPTRGARNLGTDGVDLVWTYGEGKAPSDHEYPVREVWTAPYTSDPNALEPRRLRSQIALGETLGYDPWVVGCGHAARGGGGNGNIMVVRLSDGWAWVVPHAEPDTMIWKTLGLTCEELFGYGYVGGKSNIARVRLDSLGPGIAPD